MFKEGINDMGPNTEAFVLYAFMDCSYRRYMANKTNIDIRQEFIQDYMLTNDICDRLLEQAKEYPSETIPADPESEDSTKWVEQIKLHPEAEKIITAYQPTQTQANDLFVSSGAADCEALERIYSAQVEANKTNLEYLNAVLAILNKFECDKSNIYYTAADYAYQINKTPQAAIGKASRLLKEDDVEGAIKYFDEAIELETDEAKKAKYSYIVAALMFKQGKISQCRQYCSKSLQFNPSNGENPCIAKNSNLDPPRARFSLHLFTCSSFVKYVDLIILTLQ
jgi:tetratricopeptide (TPR) repeat protein